MAKRKDPKTMVVDAEKSEGMGKIFLWVLLAAVLILGLLALLAYMLSDTFFKYDNMQRKPYYAELANGCKALNDTGCCLSSVDTMEAHNYLVFNESCPKGFEKDQLLCPSSYAWCKPEARKSNGFFG